MKEIYINNEAYKDALQKLDELLRQAEDIDIVDHKVLLYNILQYFDYIHREPLLRMHEEFKKHAELMGLFAQDETVQNLLGLYDIELKGTQNSDTQVAFVPVEQVGYITPPKKKDWLEVGIFEELEPLKLYPKNYQKVNFLVSRVGSEVFAVQNQCDGSILPMDKGALEDHFLTCPWHGCKYDLKTGKSVNYEDKKLETFPVEIEESGILKVEISY